MRRAIVTSTATVSGIVLLLGLKSHPAGANAGGAAQPISIGNDPGSSATSSAPTGSSGGGTAAAPTTGATTKAGSTSGSGGSSGTKVVTGDAADTPYGPVQLKVTFTGKKITKIDVVQYPSESRRDQEINQFALPVLNQEAMAAQSSNIDSVSGASYTSDGYLRSLQSAIDKAGA